MGKKRKTEGGGERSKKRMFYGKGRMPLQDGMQGAMVTCDQGKVGLAASEIVALFTEFYERYEDKTAPKDEGAGAEAGDKKEQTDEWDIAADLEAELADLRGKKTPKTFSRAETGVQGTFFVRFPKDIVPSAFVHSLLLELRDTKQQRTRFCNKIYPADRVVRAVSVDATEEYLKKLMATHLPPSNALPRTYKVEFSKRLHNVIRQIDVLDVVGGLIGPLHRVNLTNPDKVILVCAVKGYCCVSILDDYPALKKYNIRMLCEDARGQQPSEKQQSTTGKKEKGKSAPKEEKKARPNNDGKDPERDEKSPAKAQEAATVEENTPDTKDATT